MKKTSILLLLFVAIGCSVTVKTINKSKNAYTTKKHSGLSSYANQYFWKNFHEGNYTKIDSILYYLSAAYNENPNDLETTTRNLRVRTMISMD